MVFSLNTSQPFSQYRRPTPKANWKVGFKGASDSGLLVSTSIHCREPRQRQKEILGRGGEANHHLSALSNSSIDRDTNSSISYAHTHTDTHTRRGANEVQNKRRWHMEWTKCTIVGCGQIPNCTQPSPVPPFSISMIKRPRSSTAYWGGILGRNKGHPGWETAEKERRPNFWRQPAWKLWEFSSALENIDLCLCYSPRRCFKLKPPSPAATSP